MSQEAQLQLIPLAPLLQAPGSCRECAASCPMKQTGCPFDKAIQLIEYKKGLGSAAHLLDEKPVLEILAAASKRCWQDVVAKVNEQNALIADQNRAIEADNQMLSAMERLLERPELVARFKHLTATEVRHQRPAPVEHARATVEGAVTQAPAKVAQAPPTPPGRGNVDLYVNVGDVGLEARLMQESNENKARGVTTGPHNVCVSPKMRVEKFTDAYVGGLRKQFEELPFNGYLACIAKYHSDNRDLCRVSVWYLGPPQKEAAQVLKARKGAGQPEAAIEA